MMLECYSLYTPLLESYPLLIKDEFYNLPYHLSKANCKGNEGLLTECNHGDAVFYCYGHKSAGAICSSK